MSACDAIRLELGGYVLDGLESAEVVAVEEHVAGCERCRAELADLAPLPGWLGLTGPPAPAAPPDLRRRVLRRDIPARRRVPALVAAALVVLAAVGGALVAAQLDRPSPPDLAVTLEGGRSGIVGDAAMSQHDAGVEVELALTGVRSADEGYYHGWLERNGHRVSAGTFVGTPDGAVNVRLFCGGRLDDYEVVTVTWHAFDADDAVVAARSDLARSRPDDG